MTHDRSPQSWPAAIVDVAIVGLVAMLALRGVHEAAAWAIVSAIVGSRFGVAYGKMARAGGGDGNGGASVPPRSPRAEGKADGPKDTSLRLDAGTVLAAIVITLAMAGGR
jgi:hypothetical protein